MRFSLNWLKEYADITLSPKELSERLTLAGFEVEGVEELNPGISGVITAEILSVGKHPNADRLSLCEVTTGTTERHLIVCGAKNMKAGDKVALALPGATLPKGVKIGKTDLRGVVSGGMMCSEVELGLASESKGIMILPEITPVGKDILDVLGLNDVVLEVSITPNRPDCLNIRGLAREISAITGTTFNSAGVSVKEGKEPASGKISIAVTSPDCGRYTARIVEGVRIEPSPMWLKTRLESSGVRPVNNVVDATNYVMLALGQPLHAFDLDKIRGGSIAVRSAKKGETIVTIDNKELKLDEETLVIADGAGPCAIAGIMGGKDSEVKASTTRILLESAEFLPSSVRRTSRALNLSSESSYRFERGVDISSVDFALDIAAGVIMEIAGGTALKGIVDIYAKRFKPLEVELNLKRLETLLGVEVSKENIRRILVSLGMEVKDAPAGFKAVPPSYRNDIKIEADLAEEIARINGYDKIPATMPSARIGAGNGAPGKLFILRKKVKEALKGAGFLEAVNYSFISQDDFAITAPSLSEEGLRILNPLTGDEVVLRTSLIPSLLKNLALNLSRKNEDVRLFECRPVFVPDGVLPREPWKAAAIMHGRRWGLNWNQPPDEADFYDIKGVLDNLLESLGVRGVEYESSGISYLHPGKSAKLVASGLEIAIVGEIHPDIQERFGFNHGACLFECDLTVILDKADIERTYAPLPRFPESARDVAFVLDDKIPYSEIIGSIRSLDVKLIENVTVFDVYYGEGKIPQGKRSIALRITYRSMDKTLTNEEVEATHARVIKELSGRFKADIRM